MSVLDAFLTTWSKARQTFGEGAPQPGQDYDNSAQLRQLQESVQSAAPKDEHWRGSAADAYAAANRRHAETFGKMAELDKRLAGHVDESAQVVQLGRQNLDNVREFVMAAAASVPPGRFREQLLLPIVSNGISQVTTIMTQSSTELGAIGAQISALNAEYTALATQQQFGAG